MATTENNNAMISSYERIEGEYSFKNFLQSANIKLGTYACIGELLKRVKDAITINLTDEEIKTLKHIWETYLETKGTSPIRETMKVSELEVIFRDLWRKKPVKEGFKENTEPTPFWKSDKDIAEFWNDNNRKQVKTYHDISDYLNKETRLSFEMPTNINDDDIIESIYGFFKLVDGIGDSTVRKQLVDFICSFRSIISAKGLIQAKSVEPLINDEVVPRQIARFFVLKVKDVFFKGNHAIEKRKDNNGNSIPYRYNEIRTLSQQDNAKYADIINKIINVLLKENGGKPVYYWTNLTKFLDILRLLRNGKAHYLQELVEEGEQLPVACFILHTYVGTYLSIKKNLQNLDALSEPFDYEELGVKTLTVYFNGDLKKEVSGNEYIKNVLRPQLYRLKEEKQEPTNKADGYSEYRIERGGKYILRCGVGKNAVEDRVPCGKDEMFWNSASTNHVAFWDGVKFHFYPDISTMSSELNPLVQTAQKKDLEKIVHLLEQVESHLEGIEKGTDELKTIRETLALGQKRLEDLGDKIDRGFEQAHEDAKEQKNISKDTNRYLKVLVGLVSAVIIIGISIYLFAKDWPKERPEVLIEKGNNYLRQGNPEKAGEKYRDAIKRYEEILSKDSMDIDANIGLTMMLMRGKGAFDLELAERCAKRVAECNYDFNDVDQLNKVRRGEGLYIYLMIRNGKYVEANNKLLGLSYTEDEYSKLADGLLTIHGLGRERNQDIVKKALDEIRFLPEPEDEVIIELASIAQDGVKNENQEDAYYLYPDPLGMVSYVNYLAVDKLNPMAMGWMSDFLWNVGDYLGSLDYGFGAFACGVKDWAPSLCVRAIQSIDFDNSDTSFKQFFEKIARAASHQTGVPALLSSFVQKLEKFNTNNTSVTTKQLLSDLDGIIDAIESEDNHFFDMSGNLDNLRHFRVTLCLMSGDLSRATRLAMELDNCSDSIAVSDYLSGVCYAKGYDNTPKDSLLSDSLIFEAAKKGYVEALFTRLKKAKPLTCKLEKTMQWSQCRHLVYSEYRPVIAPPKDYKPRIYNIGRFQVVEAPSELWGITDGGPLYEEDADGRKIFYVYNYDASGIAFAPDSIWKESPKLAMELADYWLEFYRPRPSYEQVFGEESPYIPYCPKEYQQMYNILTTCYEYRKTPTGEDALITKTLPETLVDDALLSIQIGISSAFKRMDGQMARHLITMWLSLAGQTDVDVVKKRTYEEYALPEYKDSKSFVPYRKIDNPVYGY